MAVYPENRFDKPKGVWKLVNHRLAFLLKWMKYALCLLCLILIGSTETVFAQEITAEDRAAQRQAQLDSTRKARERILDSTRAARQRYTDSLTQARQQIRDSLAAVRKQRADSLEQIRKYRSSRRYKDSVKEVREARLDSIKAVRQAYNDSIRAERQRVLDSTLASRKRILDSTRAIIDRRRDSLAAIREYRSSKAFKDSIAQVRQARLDSIRAEREAVRDSIMQARNRVLDSMRAIQKRRADSLALIREYRSSKRYKDSVQVVRQERLDSIRAVRRAYNDSLAAARKAVNDSLAAVRKAKSDSIMAVRNHFLDSMKQVREQRADSLAQLKEKREEAQKRRAKNREEKRNLALALKIQKKREAWSNEQMLKKRWSWPRRIIQNTFTRYNYYFNSQRKMEEAIANMHRLREDEYEGLLPLYPFDPDRDSSAIASDMDSIIQKASIGIQIHDPRTKWGDDLYFLMGQAYYYKGDYENAITTFRYIISLRDKKQAGNRGRNRSRQRRRDMNLAMEEKGSLLRLFRHRPVHNESLLWLARTYTEAQRLDDASSVLDLLEADDHFPESLKGRLALERAYIALEEQHFREATRQLPQVVRDPSLPRWIRQRAAFINGQLLAQSGRHDSAAHYFRRVLGFHPGIDMDFYARKLEAQSLIMGGDTTGAALAGLSEVLGDAKYLPYHEQVYYVMGQAAAESGEGQQAIQYLRKGLEGSRTTPAQKAVSHALLGDIYYGARQYAQAKGAYDSAATLVGAAPQDSLVARAVRRANVLEKLTGPLNYIQDADSLLALSFLSEREQRNQVRRYIRELERRRNDSIFMAENAGLNELLAQSGPASDPFGQNPGANWYFANPSLLLQGQNEFKRKWGNRPAVDNWRRMSALQQTMTESPVAETPLAEDGRIPQLDERGLPTEESLLSFIPQTEEERRNWRDRIPRAYLDMATVYIQDLQDYGPAARSLDTLESRFENHPYPDEALYLRYLLAVRQNQLDRAGALSRQLQNQYDTSQWAALVRPSAPEADPAQSPRAGQRGSLAEHYAQSYAFMRQRQYDSLEVFALDGVQAFPDPRYQKRFQIMLALARAGQGNWISADTLSAQFIQAHPTDSLRPWAEAIRRQVAEERARRLAQTPVLNPDSTGQITLPGSQDSLESPAFPAPVDTVDMFPSEPVPAEYSYEANQPHRFVFYFQGMESRAMGVMSGLRDFNTFKFSTLSLETQEEMLNALDGVVTTRGFASAPQAKIYMNTLKLSPEVFKEYKKSEYELFLISEQNFQLLKKKQDMVEYMQFYKKHYK